MKVFSPLQKAHLLLGNFLKKENYQMGQSKHMFIQEAQPLGRLLNSILQKTEIFDRDIQSFGHNSKTNQDIKNLNSSWISPKIGSVVCSKNLKKCAQV